MQKITSSYIVLQLLICSWAMGQECFEPDATIWENTWVSCNTSANPNNIYGNGHWIQYNFGSVRNLSKTWVWNTNDPSKLDQGFNVVKIDYSLDGQEWIHWGEMNFPKGNGKAVYSGFAGPDMVGISAQYVLVTAVSNHGHSSCSGLAEVKFNLLPEYSEVPNRPECPIVEEIVVEEITMDEAFIYWEYEEETLFLFAYRVEGTTDDDWIVIDTEAFEVFLEGLTPGTTYEAAVGIECEEEEILWSEPFKFTALTGETVNTDDFSKMENRVSIFPNPNQGRFSLSYQSPTNALLNISILSIDGQVQSRITQKVTAGANTIEMNSTSLAEGIYLVEVYEPETNAKMVKKLVIAE